MLNAEIWGYSIMFFRKEITHSSKQICNGHGFTIIEVLMALAIFAIGILGVAKLQLTSVNDNTRTRKYTEASTWGVSQIESIMTTAYDAPALANGTTGAITQGIYTINWTITDSDPVPNVKKINIRVTWNNNKSFTADYYKAINF